MEGEVRCFAFDSNAVAVADGRRLAFQIDSVVVAWGLGVDGTRYSVHCFTHVKFGSILN